MALRAFTLAVLGSALICPFVVQAQQPLIDAGQQAMIQHYNGLIEQQSAPNQEEAAEKARRERSSLQAGSDIQCDVAAMKAKLRPEYERRVQAEGSAAAASWLRQKGSELGQYARKNC